MFLGGAAFAAVSLTLVLLFLRADKLMVDQGDGDGSGGEERKEGTPSEGVFEEFRPEGERTRRRRRAPLHDDWHL